MSSTLIGGSSDDEHLASLESDSEVLWQDREMELVLGSGLAIEVEVHFAFGFDREFGELPVA